VIAAGALLGLALTLAIVAFYTPTLPVAATRLLLLLAVVASMLAALRWQRALWPRPEPAACCADDLAPAGTGHGSDDRRHVP